MKRLATSCLVVFSLWCCGLLSASADDQTEMYQQVRMSDLLANPENYDGKEIQILGVFVYGYGDHWLYPTREAATNKDRRSAIRIVLHWPRWFVMKDVQEIDGRVVAIAGTFYSGGARRPDDTESNMKMKDVADITTLPCGLVLKQKGVLFGRFVNPCEPSGQGKSGPR
jgi:hypothetical protein